jgi:hypothetical protein
MIARDLLILFAVHNASLFFSSNSEFVAKSKQWKADPKDPAHIHCVFIYSLFVSTSFPESTGKLFFDLLSLLTSFDTVDKWNASNFNWVPLNTRQHWRLQKIWKHWHKITQDKDYWPNFLKVLKSAQRGHDDADDNVWNDPKVLPTVDKLVEKFTAEIENLPDDLKEVKDKFKAMSLDEKREFSKQLHKTQAKMVEGEHDFPEETKYLKKFFTAKPPSFWLESDQNKHTKQLLSWVANPTVRQRQPSTSKSEVYSFFSQSFPEHKPHFSDLARGLVEVATKALGEKPEAWLATSWWLIQSGLGLKQLLAENRLVMNSFSNI